MMMFCALKNDSAWDQSYTLFTVCLSWLFFVIFAESHVQVRWASKKNKTTKNKLVLTTTPNCSHSAKSSYSSFISPSAFRMSSPGNCFIRFYGTEKRKNYTQLENTDLVLGKYCKSWIFLKQDQIIFYIYKIYIRNKTFQQIES